MIKKKYITIAIRDILFMLNSPLIHIIQLFLICIQSAVIPLPNKELNAVCLIIA